ncbi:MAG: hypothetical protein ABUS79_10370 [Pseudomonadota bacterium]
MRALGVHAKPHITPLLWIQLHEPPFCPQTFDGRHVQLGVPPHDAGSGAQKGAGGVHGPGVQPIRLGGPKHKDSVHPDGHWPPSGSGSQTATPPPQPGWTQTSLLAQLCVPQGAAPPPLPPALAPPVPGAPARPPTPPRPPPPRVRPPPPDVPPEPPVAVPPEPPVAVPPAPPAPAPPAAAAPAPP